MNMFMARQARNTPGGWVYHVLNRSAGRFVMFRKEKDYEAFERIIAEAHARAPIRILSYCVMPTHWHFEVWPREDGEVSAFFRWLTHTHAMRWRVAHGTVGYGHLYQGRFKSFPIQKDEHALTVARYVERNALTAGLADRAEDWKWGSLWVREQGNENQRKILSEWPVDRPGDWVRCVNEAITIKELERLRMSVKRGMPYGDAPWVARSAARLGLEPSMRPEGRPRKVMEREKN